MNATKIECLKKKVHDCLVGGAMGDALGYPVEFMQYGEIVQKFGPKGISNFHLNNKGVAEISDDTQMTLFTAASALMGLTRGRMRGIGGNPGDYTEYGYRDWYYTQRGRTLRKGEHRHTWLMDVPELYSNRAPGNTCLNAIASMLRHEEVHNDSCGCGGVMRTAPLSAIYALYKTGFEKNDRAAARTAALTHKHHLGYIPAAILNHILYDIFSDESGKEMEMYVLDAISYFKGNESLKWEDFDHGMESSSELFKQRMEKQLGLLELAIELAKSDIDDVTSIHKLGSGWTGHEALAIAIFCALRYPDNIDNALIASVNHSGDSDSTGSITGQLVGAYSGIDNTKMNLQALELLDVIEEIAEDCATQCPIYEYMTEITEAGERWETKYCYHRRWTKKNN